MTLRRFPGCRKPPARPDDVLSLYAMGLGATAAPHPVGEALCVHSAPESVQVFFGEAKADVLAVYVIFAGVWQINAKVPDRAPAGEVAVMVRAGGETSPVALLRIAER